MGAAVGAQGRRIAALLNIVIALTTALVIWCAMSIGASILREVSGSALNALVAVALIAVGPVALVRRTPAPSAAGRSEAAGAVPQRVLDDDAPVALSRDAPAGE